MYVSSKKYRFLTKNKICNQKNREPRNPEHGLYFSSSYNICDANFTHTLQVLCVLQTPENGLHFLQRFRGGEHSLFYIMLTRLSSPSSQGVLQICPVIWKNP